MNPESSHRNADADKHPDSGDLARLLSNVATGRISVADATRQLSGDTFSTRGPRESASPPGVDLDLDRRERCGFPEVIYGDGKPAEMIANIIVAQRAAGQPSLATRIEASVAAEITQSVQGTRFNPIARTITAGNRLAGPLADAPPAPLQIDPEKTNPFHVAVITAGSTDAPVAEEAIETLHWMGTAFRRYDDIGVAGPARLLTAVGDLRRASVAIVIAGMEGALPAAVGGHLSVPVMAVPTSVGYGATLGGLTPMLGMLSSCASNVAVVNIDAGFKAAYLAGLMIGQLETAAAQRS